KSTVYVFVPPFAEVVPSLVAVSSVPSALTLAPKALSVVAAFATDSVGAALAISLSAIFLTFFVVTFFADGCAAATPVAAATSATMAMMIAGDGSGLVVPLPMFHCSSRGRAPGSDRRR